MFDGAIPPPLVVFPYKRYVPSHITANIPKGWGMGHSDSGWMTSEAFYEYITNVFHTWLKEKYPEGEFVVMQYEAEYFPGIFIENVENNLKVKTMTMSGNFW